MMTAPRRSDAPFTFIRVAHHALNRSLLRFAVLLALGGLAAGCDQSDASTPTAVEPDAVAGAVSEKFDHTGRGKGDEVGVAAVVAAWDAAWNAGDAKALGAGFVEDAEFVNGRGQVAIGAATITSNHALSLAGPFLGSRTKGTIRRITFLSDNAALVDVDNDLTGYRSLPPGAVETVPGVHRGRHKRVVVKRGGQWHVVAMQLTSVLP